jgi:hypothetical protein
MQIETGNPEIEGRYVVFVQCAARTAAEYCEPVIASWFNGRFDICVTDYGWIGPLPVVRCETLMKQEIAGWQKTEYEL